MLWTRLCPNLYAAVAKLLKMPGSTLSLKWNARQISFLVNKRNVERKIFPFYLNSQFSWFIPWLAIWASPWIEKGSTASKSSCWLVPEQLGGTHCRWYAASLPRPASSSPGYYQLARLGLQWTWMEKAQHPNDPSPIPWWILESRYTCKWRWK